MPEQQPLDRYHLTVVSVAEELDHPDFLPLEIRFVLSKREERKQHVKDLLTQGYGLGVRTVEKTPEALLHAVDVVSRYSQENTIIPWLPRLLEHGDLPVFTEPELRNAEKHDVNLYEEARRILERRYEFKKIVLVDLHNRGIGETERAWVQSLNEDLYPLATHYIVNRIIFDNAHARTEIAQTIMKVLLFVGPLAHALEHWVKGVGKIFAASADDLLGETAELFALRGSGFSWGTLAKRSRILVPVFALATYAAFSVEGFVQQNRLAIAGVLFGLSAVALTLTTAIQSIFLYRHSYTRLRLEKKLPTQEHRSTLSLAFVQDFTNPARMGLFIGAMLSPVFAGIVFTFFPSLVYNGWILALLGSTESIVGGMTVILARKANAIVYRHRIRKMIEATTSTR